MFDIYQAVAIFLLAVILDGLWCFYTISITRLEPWKASATGAGIYAINSFVVLSYTSNPWYILPLVAGAFLGTFLVVSHQKNKK